MSITRRSPVGQRDRWPLCLNDAARGGNIAGAVGTLRMVYPLRVCRVRRSNSVKDDGPICPRGYPALPSLEPMLALY